MSGRRSRLMILAVSVSVLVVDLATKAAALESGDVRLNPGVAFGMLASVPALADAVAGAMTVVVIALAWCWGRGPWAVLGWGLLVGGAIANALDRWLPPAGVVDWISVPWYPAYFNIADVAVRAGLLVLLVRSAAVILGEWRRPGTGLPGHDRALHADTPAP
ncbi:MAG: hypothetical protein GC156_14780 [Actinomycetales bacterium]|nr:hypothetical protein [Actinomycetales bacterium]